MGTRSCTVIMDGNSGLVRIYRQYDGYPAGHGVELAHLCNVEVINGIRDGMEMKTHANGMGCLAAQIVAGLKTEIGGIYLMPPIDEPDEEYVYIVRGGVNRQVTIECRNCGKHMFSMTPAEVIEKYGKSSKTS